MMKKTNSPAFTLIELIISSLIVACVSAAIYSVFSGGITAWKRVYETKDYERNLRLVSEVMTKEIRNTFRLSNIPFQGEKEAISFAGIIEYTNPETEVQGYGPGRIGYFLDDENILCRKQQTYAEIFQEEDTADVKQVINNVTALTFSYLGFDEDTGTYMWKDMWPDIEDDEEESGDVEEGSGGDQEQAGYIDNIEEEEIYIPKAVMIELELGDQAQTESGDKGQGRPQKADSDNMKFTKTIMITIGDDIEEDAE
jgi:type II secretory pathway pseudopilin PulG